MAPHAGLTATRLCPRRFLSPDLSAQKQPSTSTNIECVSPNTPGAPSPPYFSDRHGSLPAGGGMTSDDEPGPSSSSSARPLLPYQPPSPLQYYRYHNYNPKHRQRAGSASAESSSVSENVHVHASPSSKLQPLLDSNGHNPSETGETRPSESISSPPRSPPESTGAAPLIRRQSWKLHYVRAQDSATGSTVVDVESESSQAKKAQ